MPTYLLVTYFVVLFLVVFAAIVVFDKLVELEYRNHRDEWERDGMPWQGWLRKTQAATAWKSNSAWQQCSLAWIFTTPAWIHQDKGAFRLLKIYRVLWGLWIAGLLGGLAYRIFG